MDRMSIYQENAVATQSGGKIIVMLYEGAIRFLKSAVMEIEAGNIEEKNRLILKAEAIIDELRCSLNLEGTGEIAINLQRLYDFMHGHLVHANVRNDPQAVQDVISLLEDLVEGWRVVCE